MAERTRTQFIKYLFVGGINFLYGLVVFYVLLNVVRLHYLIAFSITWITGVVLTYVINFLWIFRPDDKLDFRSRFVKYFIVYLTSYAANMVLLPVLTESTHWDPFFVQLGLTPVIIVINFFGMKHWSLSRNG